MLFVLNLLGFKTAEFENLNAVSFAQERAIVIAFLITKLDDMLV